MCVRYVQILFMHCVHDQWRIHRQPLNYSTNSKFTGQHVRASYSVCAYILYIHTGININHRQLAKPSLALMDCKKNEKKKGLGSLNSSIAS